MYTTLSMAISADGYMDDCTSQRLILSTPLDWQEVYRLRAQADAILVGGQTLRSDDPSLGLKSKELIDMRLAAGHSGEPMRVVVSGRGEISPTAKIFSKGTGRIVIFSNIEREQIARLDGVEVVVAPCLDVAFIVTELEKRGVQRLFVEGGAQILELFLQSGMVDKLRIACNPNVVVGDSAAPYFSAQRWLSHFEGEGLVERQELDGMQIISLSMGGGGRDEAHDRELMERAMAQSRRSPERSSCYRVGAVVECANGDLFEGYTLETSPTHHAEQAAICKAQAAGADLAGATIYSSMEPCSVRSSEPESCSQLIIRHGMRRALFALYEPSHFVECQGAENMRRAGVRVDVVSEYADEVRRINSHVLD